MLTVLTILSLSAPGDVTVTLPLEAHVRGTEVELVEIAEIVGADPEEVQRIGSIELGYAPAPGYSRLFVVERIRETLTAKAPGITIRFQGQRATRVYPEVRDVPGQAILDAARQELTGALSARDVSIESTGELPSVEIPAGASDPAFRARLAGPVHASGRVSVPVEIYVDGVRYRTVWTSFDVRLWETRPVLSAPVRAGQELGPQLFRRERVLVRNAAQGERLSRESLVGAVAARDISAGSVVGTLDVHRPILVALGQSVFLSVRKGAVEARVAAIALESGAIGDRIRVRTAPSSQELIATVTSRDSCRLVLGQ